MRKKASIRAKRPGCGKWHWRGGLCLECRGEAEESHRSPVFRAAAAADPARQRRILIYTARSMQGLPLFEPPVTQY